MMKMRVLYPLAARACSAAALARGESPADKIAAKESAHNCLTDLLAALERLDVKTDRDIPPIAHAVGGLLHITIGYCDTPLGPTSNAWSKLLMQFAPLIEAEVEQFMEAVNGKSN
jgi:hypothetical protein